MNADVEKAVERVNEGEAVTATPHPDCDALVKLVDLDDWHTIRQALRDQEAEIARLRGLLGECYVLAGADTDGDLPERCAMLATSAVAELRKDYDDVLDWQDRAEKAEALLRRCRDTLSKTRPLRADITAHLGAEQ